jgi:hypothetical protein
MAAGNIDMSRTKAAIWQVDDTPRRLVASIGARLTIKNQGPNPVLLRLIDDASWTNTDPASPVNAPGEVLLALNDVRAFEAGTSVIRARTGVALPATLLVTQDNV